MVTVNWEREPGEKIEEFVAALLLLTHPHGNHITPSSGDRGVDVLVWNPDGYDIYQVKRYSRPLTSRQATMIEESWHTFVAQTLPALPVRSWTLVTPWNPSNERLDWLRGLTDGHDFPVHWMGGRTLDGMASQRPSLVDYYFGDGGERWHRLMAEALHAGRDTSPGSAGEDLLEAIIARHRSLTASLNEVDPFYRYELEIRAGHLRDHPFEADLRRHSPVAEVQYTQLDPEHFQVMRIVPLCAESTRLRPITTSLRLEVTTGSAEHQAVEEFRHFGAPIHAIPGTVTETTGPPGHDRGTGDGLFSIMPLASSDDLPDFEVRLVTANGAPLHTLDLVDVAVSRGISGPGMWLSGRDRSDVLQFKFYLNGPDGDEVRIQASSLAGKTPADVLPAIRMAADFVDGNGILLAVRGGRPLTSAWDVTDSALRANAQWHVTLLDALQAIQRHTYQRVTIPDVQTIPADDIETILRTGRLLRGERIETPWTEVTLTVVTPDRLPPTDAEFSFISEWPLTVRLGDREITVTAKRRVLYQAARVADPAESASAEPGATLRLLPGSTDQAVIVAVPVDPHNLATGTGGETPNSGR
ncbi:hypothetical protein I0C86_03085 [Plantactinospora sp. S1510]|uniref:Restriction endonuclease type IV Mrr domain-containing protein n=1 Tax=Plantactinospora alkalitolerans TaxID=2789879 RepID=A0ABS0GP73_9ACTN|nr:hypothetical protein [Plantactinospora alkalitolerans]MBF9127986.1 hypothetical protein [Plantactinospora alkalitolerans]